MNTDTYINILDGPCTDQITDPLIKYPFELDDFQKHAHYRILQDENVLVTAHTGSGKTLIAELAIAHAIKAGMKVIYTSPIKSLSNQKFKEFKEKFQDGNTLETKASVGILTGDIKFNPDAQILIMTTEILRNMLYRIKRNQTLKDQVKGMSDEDLKDDFLDNVESVIFDEVHYINNKERGKIWEETIVMLPPRIKLVMLSATIDRADDFARWVGNIKKKVMNLIPTSKRVIPLRHFVYADEKLHMIQDQHNKFDDVMFNKVYKIIDKVSTERYKKHKRGTNYGIMTPFIQHLEEKCLMPVIFFSFSRKNCERYASHISQTLVSGKEIQKIELIFHNNMKPYEEQYRHMAQYGTIRTLLLKGIAFHHSGLIPVLKEIIEILFQQGLIKVLFATETFAVGVNMPTKTVVFTELSKWCGERRFLHTDEYKQMSGRAGRRGLDKTGTVIYLPLKECIEHMDIRNVMIGKVPHITSQFELDYQFLLKMIQSEGYTFKDFLDASLYGLDSKKQTDKMSEQYNVLKARLDSFSIDIDDNTRREFDRYAEMEETLNSGFNIQKKKLKKIKKEMTEIEKIDNFKEQYTNYCDYWYLEQDVLEIEKRMSSFDTHTMDELTQIVGFLRETEYIKMSGKKIMDISSEDILIKGIIASHINECCPIILTEMITRKVLYDLSPVEIVSVIAIFVDERMYDERLTLFACKCNYNVKDRLERIHGIAEKLITVEKKHGLKYHLKGYWDVHYEFVEPAHMWASGEPISAVLGQFDIYEGNFIRAMMKIGNICRDLATLCQVYGDLQIIPKLKEVNDLIIRDIVSVNSLYIK